MLAAVDARPGRYCPVHYGYAPRSFARAPELTADVLYVVGGLYGNEQSLDAVERLAAQEQGEVRIVFNGDFHWFDVDRAAFSRIGARVRAHVACRGNVETELAAAAADAGCGCAYPDTVSDAEVARSNAILARLRDTAHADPAAPARLAALPMTCVAEVGAVRVAIAHGDPESLAGWGCSHDRLDAPGARGRVESWLRAADARVIATSHTCLPACRTTASGAVINNGAAGMPNFADTDFGVVTRIGVTPAPAGAALYGTRIAAAHVDAVRLDFDADAFARAFLSSWPAGSAAHESYWSRIAHGPPYTVAQAQTRSIP